LEALSLLTTRSPKNHTKGESKNGQVGRVLIKEQNGIVMYRPYPLFS